MGDQLREFSVEGMTVVVTGGASGLGRGYCSAFALAGSNVVVADINVEREGEVNIGSLVYGSDEARLKARSGRAITVRTDVTSRGSVRNMVARSLMEFGRIDVLVNNAGGWTFHNAEEPDDADWTAIMRLNLDGTNICCQEVGRTMIPSGGGSIINVSSVSSLIINPPGDAYLDGAYFASKAAVNHLTRSLAVQWASHGIRVNAIAPGYMSKGGSDIADPRPDCLDNIPMNRLGRPEDLGTVAVFLASRAAGYITGQVIQVDGGYTLS